MERIVRVLCTLMLHYILYALVDGAYSTGSVLFMLHYILYALVDGAYSTGSVLFMLHYILYALVDGAYSTGSVHSHAALYIICISRWRV